MKKVLASVLAVTMAVGMSASAFAATPRARIVPLGNGDSLYAGLTVSSDPIIGDAWAGNDTADMLRADLTVMFRNGKTLKGTSGATYGTLAEAFVDKVSNGGTAQTNATGRAAPYGNVHADVTLSF